MMAPESNRYKKILIGVIVVALVMLGKIFYIQLITDKYKKASESNAVVYDVIYPPRGIIFDRNGLPLVTNQASYDIMVSPRKVDGFDTVRLAEVLDTTVDFIRQKMEYYRTYRTRIGFQEQTLIRQANPSSYMKFCELQYLFPGFRGQTRVIRDYPFNSGGNLLGYISEVDADYLAAHPGEYKSGEYIGKTGIEAVMEEQLRGEKGYKVYSRDSRNIIQDSYKNGELDKDAVPGKNVRTTIDANLQQYGQELMKGKSGSLIAIEPATGEILAMISSPGIDVNVLGDIGKYYDALSKDPHKPMFNRTVQASYPPGSVFKLVNGLIGLQEGVLEPWMTYPCDRGYSYANNRKLGCHSHRSPLNLEEAIMMSCNAYFCYVLKNILSNSKYSSTEEAFDAWREYVTSFGFSEKLGADFTHELGGNIPTSKYYNKMYGKGRWRFQTIVSLSIGQGEIGVTPLQLANFCATLANRGYFYTPHIVKDSDDLQIDARFKERHYTKVDTTHFHKVIKGMWRAVNCVPGEGGTATAAAVPGLDICGKTGTAQNPHGKDNSVFMCFAPMDNPQIAVVAYIENAGFGATWACPIASLLTEKYLRGEISEERKYLEDRVLNTRLIQ